MEVKKLQLYLMLKRSSSTIIIYMHLIKQIKFLFFPLLWVYFILPLNSNFNQITSFESRYESVDVDKKLDNFVVGFLEEEISQLKSDWDLAKNHLAIISYLNLWVSESPLIVLKRMSYFFLDIPPPASL